MAFLDNLSKRATETTARAMQKAQELSEVSRINAQISEEEKKVNATYYQIGKLYVSLHGLNGEDAFQGMVTAVLEGEQKIAEYRKRIEDVKGVQRCTACGAVVPQGIAFCSTCGAALPKSESDIDDDTVRCESCGTMVKRGMRFCTTCGKPMSLPTVPDVPSAPSAGEDAASAASGKKFCANCGAENEGDTLFCVECGTKL